MVIGSTGSAKMERKEDREGNETEAILQPVLLKAKSGTNEVCVMHATQA